MKTIKSIRLLRILVLAFLLSVTVNAQNRNRQTKTEMSVLFVGFNPEKTMPAYSNFRDFKSDRFKLDFLTRWPAFNIYLKSRFTNVSSVDARDYKEEMSANFDVTIFDELPNPIKEKVVEKDAEGQIVKYEKEEYLSKNYNYATIFIGKTAPDMGANLGSKLDWHCFCLDADAVDVQTEHPIFNEPVKVNLTMTLKDTPNNFFYYPNSENLPEQIPMWRVQGLGYHNSDYGIGMVSHSSGFLDSPDTEYISGGTNSKNMEAVAIGRHGNLFMWGFSASPDYMTEEAQQVFANAIVYMKQFNGAELIAKKMKNVSMRDDHLFYKNRDLNLAKFEEYKNQWLKYKAKDIARKKELETKKANGETLNKFQQSFLDKMPMVPTLETWLEKQIGKAAYNEFGTNMAAYLKALNSNIEYYTHLEGEYYPELDKDVQSLGVSNRKIEFLDAVIPMLKKGNKKATLAKSLLSRYTNESFKTYSEWSNWLNTNRDKLFYTESGGDKWLVNTLKQ